MQLNTDVQLFPLGDQAIVISCGNFIDLKIHRFIRSISDYLDNYSFEGFISYVPAFTSVTIFYDPLLLAYSDLETMIWEMLHSVDESDTEAASRLMTIPVLYGGDFGPDLGCVAAHTGLTGQEIVALHQSPEYLVYMIGFAPGFPYLGGMDERLATPRKESPRGSIPAGSVGIAGTQTGVYPIQTPGGWQIIGRTPMTLFDSDADEPVLLKAGDRIKFLAITEVEFKDYKRQIWESRS